MLVLEYTCYYWPFIRLNDVYCQWNIEQPIKVAKEPFVGVE
jgi:hypothetical protein